MAGCQKHKLNSAEQWLREWPVLRTPQGRLSTLLPLQLIALIYLMCKHFGASTFPRISFNSACFESGLGLSNSTRQEVFELKGRSGRKPGKVNDLQDWFWQACWMSWLLSVARTFYILPHSPNMSGSSKSHWKQAEIPQNSSHYVGDKWLFYCFSQKSIAFLLSSSTQHSVNEH